MDKSFRIAFIWQGFSGRYGLWHDGLWRALKHIEENHVVGYFEPWELDKIHEFRPDFVLYWEAPVTSVGKNADYYRGVCNLPYKKGLCFAGGLIKKEWMPFDVIFVESAINEKECDEQGLKWVRAFGVNTDIFKPERQPKVFWGVHPATSASWKRQWLMTEALKEKSAICGRFQQEDPTPFTRSRDAGACVFPDLSAEAVSALLNMSHTLVNTSEYWGGGQRATLEAMACGVFPIVMSDAPKNMEYVLESGFGAIVEPEMSYIKKTVQEVVENGYNFNVGVQYIQSKWTAKHYADNLLKGIKEVI